MNDYTPQKVYVTNPYGKRRTYPSKYRACRELGIYMASLLGFLRRGTCTRGKYSGWKFETETGQ